MVLVRGAGQPWTMHEQICTRIDGVQQWLLDQQMRNGSWINSPWHTAKIMMALIETGVDPTHDKVLKAFDWLREVADKPQSGQFSWEGWTWDTALVIRAIQRLHTDEKLPYIQGGLDWMKKEERRQLTEPVSELIFGRCYTAQVILAMIETGDNDSDTLHFFIEFVKNQQDRSGGWISHFDTAQILEAFAVAGVCESSREWVVEQNGQSYKGGVDRAIRWIEASQSRFGNWDGLTWPTAWILRAYLLTAKYYDPRLIALGLGWMLEQRAGMNPSWFHELGRSASSLITLKVALDKLSESQALDLDMPVSRFFLSVNRYSSEKAAGELMDEQELRAKLEHTEARLTDTKHRLNTLRRRLKISALVICAILFLVLAILGFFYSYNFASYVLAILGVVLAIPILNIFRSLLKERSWE